MEERVQHHRLSPEDELAYGQKSMNWYGFGSPVGLAILLVSIGLCSVLLRIAAFGF